MEDRRARTRFDVRYPVTITTSQGAIQAETKDISADGAFIRSQEPLDPRDKVCLCIEFRPGVSGEVDAEVIWSTAYGSDDAKTERGMGVRFLW